MIDNQNWLAEYVQTGSDAAFRELVTRYVDLVYSTALRLVGGDTHRAQDVAQTVFVNLARVARTLPQDVKLGGWLHRDTCFAASTLMRGERRRQSRERQAVEMNALQNNSPADYSFVAPVLDEAINELDEVDRAAILLRFYEQSDFRSVGQALGSNEDAARMRVSRALEKLEGFLKRRGVTTSAASLGLILSANAIQAAPVGLAATISTAAAFAGTTIATTTATTIAMTTLQKTLIATTLVAAVGTGLYEVRQAADLRTQVQTLHQQTAPLIEEMRELTRERDDANSKLAVIRNEDERSNSSTAELLKLRGEVARLRRDSQELALLKASATTEGSPLDSAAKSWLTRVDQLKQGLKQMPDKEIPEVRLLGEKDWLEAVKRFDELGTEAEIRKALSSLRELGKQRFAELLRKALRGYAEANDGQLPADISQLKPHFAPALDDAVLQRYQIAQTGRLNDVPSKEALVIETAAPVDDQHDTVIRIRMNGTSVTTIPNNDNLLRDALQAFSAANNGREPNDPAQLLPYARTPEQQAVLQQMIQNRGPR